jgi:cephalosporin hydroxylase
MITIDMERATVSLKEGDTVTTHAMNTPEAFEIVSNAWLRVGWDTKHVYTFTWLGRPIIQLPEDMVRLQEVIFAVNPDLIIETGVAHGGSLVFYASLCKSIEKGRVIGIDIEIRPHNRRAIEEHFLAPMITLIEGSSTAPETVAQVRAQVKEGESVMIFLDSNHTKEHVTAELNTYAPLVSKGSYIVAMDGIMEQVVGGPRTSPDWVWNNPRAAALDFVQANPDFVLEDPTFLFNEGLISKSVTYWPGGFIKRIR